MIDLLNRIGQPCGVTQDPLKNGDPALRELEPAGGLAPPRRGTPKGCLNLRDDQVDDPQGRSVD